MDYLVPLVASLILIGLLTIINRATSLPTSLIALALSVMIWLLLAGLIIVCLAGRGACDAEMYALAEAALGALLLLFCSFAADRLGGREPLFDRFGWSERPDAFLNPEAEKPQSILSDLTFIAIISIILGLVMQHSHSEQGAVLQPATDRQQKVPLLKKHLPKQP